MLCKIPIHWLSRLGLCQLHCYRDAPFTPYWEATYTRDPGVNMLQVFYIVKLSLIIKDRNKYVMKNVLMQIYGNRHRHSPLSIYTGTSIWQKSISWCCILRSNDKIKVEYIVIWKSEIIKDTGYLTLTGQLWHGGCDYLQLCTIICAHHKTTQW